MRKYLLLIFLTGGIISTYRAVGQDDPNYNETLGQGENAISTAVPFLMIAPDSRAGAMGDAGAATSPDGYSQNWNSSKLAFIESPLGMTISYTPWLKKLVDDINLAYISGYYRLDKIKQLEPVFVIFRWGILILPITMGIQWEVSRLMN
jgi:hypothetical protein